VVAAVVDNFPNLCQVGFGVSDFHSITPFFFSEICGRL
jgi:hypothetical protein